jgi:aspartate kinase
VREPKANGSAIRGITAIRNVALVTVEGRGMQGVPGMAARTFTAVARESINVLMISQSSSEQNICLLVEAASAARAVQVLQNEFKNEMVAQNIDHVWVQDKIAIIAVVGSAIKKTPGVAARVFRALAEQDINIIAIAQGSSEYNLSLVVDESDADKAVRAIHHSIVNK